MKLTVRFFLIFGWAAFGSLLCASAQEPALVEKLSDGVLFSMGGTFLKLEVRGETILRVAAARDRAFFRRSSIAVLPSRPSIAWTVTSGPGATTTLSTTKLQARVDHNTGVVTFLDPTGKVILAEKTSGRTFEPVEVLGEKTFHVRQQWLGSEEESLYGLGQLQLGVVDLKGFDIDLWQRNTVIVVPCLVSSRGYGILWDNTSFSRFGDLRRFEPIPGALLFDHAGQPGGLTTGNIDSATGELRTSVTSAAIGFAAPQGGGGSMSAFGLHPPTRTLGEIAPPVTGDYQFQAYSNGGIKVWLNGKLVIDHWRQDWLPEYDQIKVRLEAGKKYTLKIETDGERSNVMRLQWKTPEPTPETTTSLWSNVGDGIDYYFVYGPALDHVVADFRALTGRATMLPQWAFGFWQSRDHYQNQKELLDVVAGFRERKIPFDNIVQDWQYWTTEPVNDWGSHRFDPHKFPDPSGMIKAVHDAHAHIMISLWGKFYEGTGNFNALNQGGYLFQRTLKEGIRRDDRLYAYVDPFQEGARKMFWDQVNTALFSKGIDAWWMDATEPEIVSPPGQESYAAYMNPTGMGSGARMQNGYALMTAKALYEGQRATVPNQRVYILTRSGFAGEQRYGALSWSGDVTSTWSALRKQIPAGLGFALAGLPYWTTDTGGYLMQNKFALHPSEENKAEWLELNSRWFQFSTFCPILRVHGQQQLREMFNLGDGASAIYQSERKFDELRYALLPYIYSLAGAVTQDGGTLMRPLVMDFPSDKTARVIPDEYMFGPAFLVAPVTTYKARSRSVYLPGGVATWYDFWTGSSLKGEQTVEAPAPFDSLPVYVRAGSIIPVGLVMEYTGQKPADPLTFFIYTGADGTFTLYEDDGLTYDYEKGAFSRVEVRWDDLHRTLMIGRRAGSFPGMLDERTFQIVLISPEHPAGFSSKPRPTTLLHYTGEEIKKEFAP